MRFWDVRYEERIAGTLPNARAVAVKELLRTSARGAASYFSVDLLVIFQSSNIAYKHTVVELCAIQPYSAKVRP